MSNATPTREFMEERVRAGEANELKGEILLRVYEWKGTIYRFRYSDTAADGSMWVLETEPMRAHTPPPPSPLAQIIAIVLEARAGVRSGDPSAGAEAFARIVRVLESEALLS